MLQSLSLINKKHLCDTALWVIMDPWINQSKLVEAAGPNRDTDVLSGYNIDDWNKRWADKIYNFLPRAKNWLVVTDLGYYDKATNTDIPTPIDPRFSHLPVVEHRYLGKNMIIDYMPDGCESIVYTGFHEQMCILHRKYIGYHRINSENDLNLNRYIALELVCHWPSPHLKTRLQRQEQRRARDYKYIRVLDDVK
jgi:hypothetical protein